MKWITCVPVVWPCHTKTCLRAYADRRRPRSACASGQSDQDLRCPLPELLDTIDGICPDEILRMLGISLNLCLLRMLEDTFTHGASQLMFNTFM